MRVEFSDKKLQRLFEDVDFVPARMDQVVIRAFRKKVGLLMQAETEIDILNLKSLRYKKLKGDREGQKSIRLNDQWRLILLVDSDGSGNYFIVVEIVDHH